MTDTTNTAEVIESLVNLVHGDSDARVQQLFRQNLQVLVELAKGEQRRDWSIEMSDAVSHRGVHMVH
jgi:hypothetical protein